MFWKATDRASRLNSRSSKPDGKRPRYESKTKRKSRPVVGRCVCVSWPYVARASPSAPLSSGARSSRRASRRTACSAQLRRGLSRESTRFKRHHDETPFRRRGVRTVAVCRHRGRAHARHSASVASHEPRVPSRPSRARFGPLEGVLKGPDRTNSLEPSLVLLETFSQLFSKSNGMPTQLRGGL